MGLLPAPIKPIISVQKATFKGFRAGRLSEKSYYIRLRELLHNEIIFAEHIIFNFPENIISRFDVSVNDVAKEFAEKLRMKYGNDKNAFSKIVHDTRSYR